MIFDLLKSLSEKSLSNIYLGSLDHTAILRKGETGEIIHKFIGHEGPVWSCDMNSDATIVATASEDCTVYAFIYFFFPHF